METAKATKAYSEIISALKKHRDIIVFDVERLERESKYHLFGLELKERYGLNIDPKKLNSTEWNKLKEYCSIGLWGKKHNRKISWPDDGTQPEDELLLEISFPTGAYIFGDHYPTELFQRFFLELKLYGAKYTDTRNNNLYFSMDNAKGVFNSFSDILHKYREINKEDFNRIRIEQMEKELAELRGKTN